MTSQTQSCPAEFVGRGRQVSSPVHPATGSRSLVGTTGSDPRTSGTADEHAWQSWGTRGWRRAPPAWRRRERDDRITPLPLYEARIVKLFVLSDCPGRTSRLALRAPGFAGCGLDCFSLDRGSAVFRDVTFPYGKTASRGPAAVDLRAWRRPDLATPQALSGPSSPSREVDGAPRSADRPLGRARRKASAIVPPLSGGRWVQA